MFCQIHLHSQIIIIAPVIRMAGEFNPVTVHICMSICSFWTMFSYSGSMTNMNAVYLGQLNK